MYLSNFFHNVRYKRHFLEFVTNSMTEQSYSTKAYIPYAYLLNNLDYRASPP